MLFSFSCCVLSTYKDSSLNEVNAGDILCVRKINLVFWDYLFIWFVTNYFEAGGFMYIEAADDDFYHNFPFWKLGLVAAGAES
jgi:hypothetical protein